ncbi:MAG: single-stranded DNA-binding protein [Candidatus Saganbacteria bacterium]|nr:single-stranded DNA-binding protein [Candidatus Saganbacteria bacterium]
MANLNRIILIGRLTADPEGRATAEGMAVTRFRLAVDRPAGGVPKEDNVDFIDVVAWQRLAEICAQYLKKGRLVLVEGRIQNRSFEDQTGQRRWVTEVVARNMTMLDKGQGTAGKGPEETKALVTPAAEADEIPADEAELESDLPF